MTPKERANELFNSMKGFRVKHSHAKRCAKNAVQLLLSNIEEQSPAYEYYSEVFKEITEIKTP